MPRPEELRSGAQRVRVGRWRDSDRIGLITPLASWEPPGEQLVREACRLLADRGFAEVLSSALAVDERAGFEAAGFEVRDRLHLLAHDLVAVPPVSLERSVARLRRGRRRDRDRALAVDGAAFPSFWRLDQAGLQEAMDATTVHRFRVATAGGRVAGYAVTGRAGRTGYLQRLAVAPDAGGRGIGRALVADALEWLQRHGCQAAMVNTQVDNGRALALYEGMGFVRQPTGLVVLGRALP